MKTRAARFPASSYTFIATALVVWAYYWLQWRTFQGFVEGVDHHPQFMQDFVAYYYPMGQKILHTAVPFGGYFYSSFFALLLAPVAALPLSAAMNVWVAVQIAATAVLGLVAARGVLKLSSTHTILFLAICATSYPILNNFKWGQVSVLLTACVIAAVALSLRHRSVPAGVILAFAAAIKFYPALFLLWFVLRRDIAACISFVLAFAVFYALVPIGVLGYGPWLGFEQAILDMINRAGLAATDTNSQYIVRVAGRWFPSLAADVGRETFQRIFGLVGYAFAAGSLVAAWVFQKRGGEAGGPLSLAALFTVVPFVVKTSWPHYFAYLPVCQAIVLLAPMAMASTSRRLARTTLVIVSGVLSSALALNFFSGWELYNSRGTLFVANGALWLAVCLLAWALFAPPQPSPEEY